MRLLLNWLITHVIFFFQQWHQNVSREKRHEIIILQLKRSKKDESIRWLFPHCDQGKASLTTTTTLLKTSGGVCSRPSGAPLSFQRSTIRAYHLHIKMHWGNLSSPAYAHVCPHQSKEGFSPQSKASCSSLTRLACPGSLNRPSSRRPHCRMKSTHCSTSIGASLFPNRRSYRTVSSNFWPKIPETQNVLHLMEKVNCSATRNQHWVILCLPHFLTVICKLWCQQ